MRFDDLHLSGESTRASSPAELLDSEYDYLLLGSSWDSRCLSLTTVTLSAGVIQLFIPRNMGVGSARASHDLAMSEFAAATGASVDVINEGSEEVETVFDRIDATIMSLRKQLDRPLRMLVDLSAMPRYLSLGAVALGLTENVGERVDVFYAEAEYGQIVQTSAVAIPEYSAAWEAIAVPRLEGDWYPTSPRHLVIAVGFEAAKVTRLTERWDPDLVTVLFPSPGIKPEYEETTAEANSLWMQRLGLSEERVLKAPPADAVAVWRLLSETAEVQSPTENVYCLMCGTKPHGLGMALYGLARERPAVMYVRPTAHEQREITPNGTYWLYRLRDRTLPV